ncbi:MAG: DegV family protein [Eubacteriales bacterium]|jgi:DegV family protein with EDD domain|nr:DegV family protein [Eubacteriales bacterium]
MNRIAIVTDSTADLPIEIAKEHNITVVPLKVNFQDKSYTEGVDITNQEFYEKLEKADLLPTTSQPSPADFIAKYDELIENGYDSIISIHISDKLSGTRQSATIAGSELFEKITNLSTVDSMQVTVGIGLVVKIAAESAAQNKSYDEVLADTKQAVENVKLYALVDTLKYLEKGGRIGKARAIAGSLLNIKPILTMNNGEIVDKDKVRTRKKGIAEIVDLAKKFKDTNGTIRYAISHSMALDEAKKLEETLLAEVGVKSEFISEVGSVVGTHIGPGALFISFL